MRLKKVKVWNEELYKLHYKFFGILSHFFSVLGAIIKLVINKASLNNSRAIH
jgi:hypothetical protein